MLHRLDRDVLGQSGVKWLVFYGGWNDLAFTTKKSEKSGSSADSRANADRMIAGIKEMIARAHARGIKVYSATITPRGGAEPAAVAMWQMVNAWIRTGGAFDAVFEFDKAVADPEHPTQLLPQYDAEAGHTHLTDLGYQTVVDGMDLAKFE